MLDGLTGVKSILPKLPSFGEDGDTQGKIDKQFLAGKIKIRWLSAGTRAPPPHGSL